ncbi:hypothetical protein Snoj_83320 [Streptomyces nojiriensis]|uniref:Xaa-Pro dipeptidyl-peptidase C-terminal domain-containing protein n=1 Tax=Streptomyces nojiriensis TaxID=66374 RepID=A0ABQ3T1Z6_9ACTN|nr:hypothetical protein Snoj_83320 [Streptomyces nojiriensis]
MTYRAANPGSTFVAYLLDTAPDGTAHIITHAPYTDVDSPPDSLISADIDLQATAYDVPRGHRLMLVIDARDPFYADANLPRATLDFTSPEAPRPTWTSPRLTRRRGGFGGRYPLGRHHSRVWGDDETDGKPRTHH